MSEIKLTILFGEKKLMPPTYTLKKLPNGRGELESELIKLTGDYCDLLVNSRFLGGKVMILS